MIDFSRVDPNFKSWMTAASYENIFWRYVLHCYLTKTGLISNYRQHIMVQSCIQRICQLELCLKIYNPN